MTNQESFEESIVEEIEEIFIKYPIVNNENLNIAANKMVETLSKLPDRPLINPYLIWLFEHAEEVLAVYSHD